MKNLLLIALLVAAPAVHASGLERAAKKKLPLAPATDTGPVLSDQELRGQVDAYLGSIDTPIGAEQWKGLGPRAGAILEGIAKNGDELPTRRAKAVDGIAGLKWEPGLATVRALAADEAAPPVLRFSSVRALGAVLPKAQAERELKALLEGAKDARVRAVAGEVLSHR